MSYVPTLAQTLAHIGSHWLFCSIVRVRACAGLIPGGVVGVPSRLPTLPLHASLSLLSELREQPLDLCTREIGKQDSELNHGATVQGVMREVT